ncbi:MAG: hypothetical protein RJA07_899 [Bacteroidota bacterium]|jgi:hypothetical protein
MLHRLNEQFESSVVSLHLFYATTDLTKTQAAKCPKNVGINFQKPFSIDKIIS